jgi:hypothetical protein
VVGRKTQPENQPDPGGDDPGQDGDRLDDLAQKVDRLADVVASLVPGGQDLGGDDDGDVDAPSKGKGGRPSLRDIELQSELVMERAARRLREIDPQKPGEKKEEKAPPEVAPVKTPFLRKILWGEEVK